MRCRRLRRACIASASNAGFTYLWVLLMVAAMGVGLASAAQVWVASAQRERERELLFVGNQFRQAISRYYESSPGPVKQFPRSIDELLEDRRSPVVRRHLRRHYPDPMTGSRDWVLIRGPGNAIIGVRSRSEATPLRRVFDARDQEFAGKTSIAQWEFVYSATASGVAGAATGIAQPERTSPEFITREPSLITSAPPAPAQPFAPKVPSDPAAGSRSGQNRAQCNALAMQEHDKCMDVNAALGAKAARACLAKIAALTRECLARE